VCARLRQQGLPFHLHLIGSGPDESLLRAAVERHGLADHVTFHGSRTRAEVASLLPEMDLAVTPSVPTSDGRKEGIPVALMEAMACGLPAVASRLTGIPELVADRITGRLVPPGDPASLADAIQELAQQPALRDRWGQAARQVIERHFDLRRNAEQLLAAIHEVHAAMGEEQAKSEGGATRCTS
jgi:colanic acid/amylovoran biosynthesis glycosyltransferase